MGEVKNAIRGRKLYITNSIDFLVTLLLFYNFANWFKYDSVTTKILGLFACIFTLNDWMIVREAYEFYTTRMFVLDIFSSFCFANLPNALMSNNTIYGYDSSFFLFIAGIELMYGIWDISISQISPIEKRQQSLNKWALCSFISVFLSLVTFYIQKYLPIEKFFIVGKMMGIGSTIFIFAMLVVWNIERYILSKKANLPFIT